jgi:hypothetical protein
MASLGVVLPRVVVPLGEQVRALYRGSETRTQTHQDSLV